MSVAAPTRDPVVVVDRDNPYPGLHAFTESDAGFFYGRNHEGAELFRLVKRRVLTRISNLISASRPCSGLQRLYL